MNPPSVIPLIQQILEIVQLFGLAVLLTWVWFIHWRVNKNDESFFLQGELTIKRVRRTALFDGYSMSTFGGLGLLFALLLLDITGLLVCGGVLAAGLIEIHGANHLRDRKPDGVGLMFKSQMLVLAVIGAYAGWNLIFPTSLDSLLAAEPTEVRDVVHQIGGDDKAIHQLVRTFSSFLYEGVAFATLLMQGSLAAYYHRRKSPIERFLATPPPVTKCRW